MKETKYCQSCGMPLTTPETKGTDKEGRLSEDYCTYCYRDGAFQQDCSMEEMIEICLTYGKDEGFYTDQEKARQQMMEWFPTLKRWRLQD